MDSGKFRRRRLLVIVTLLTILCFLIFTHEPLVKVDPVVEDSQSAISGQTILAKYALNKLEIKDHALGMNYSRNQFGADWGSVNGCDTRNIILNRDLFNIVTNEKCQIISGILNDPYTGRQILFTRGTNTSSDIQIDHVVSLSNAWKTGAQGLTYDIRVDLANDPLELLAVDGVSNQIKGDQDASGWLPENENFRCQYVARQVAVKQKYTLWVTRSEYNAILNVLESCPNQLLLS